MVQEHTNSVEELVGEWVYTYGDINRDYLRHPAGVRQRERSGGNDTDYYMLLDGARLEGKTEREAVSTTLAGREERTASLNQISGRTFDDISNLATTSNYIEMYGGGTAGTTAGFDGLVQRGGRHFLAGLDMSTNMKGNKAQPFVPEGRVGFAPSFGIGGVLPRSGITPLDEYPWDPDNPKWPDWGNSTEDFANDPVSGTDCPDCCKEMLLAFDPPDSPNYDFSSREGWCSLCCGSRVTTMFDCNYTIEECWLQCCYDHSPDNIVSSDEITQYVLDHCVTFDQELINRLLDKLNDFENANDLIGLIINCILHGGTIESCIAEYIIGKNIPGFADILILLAGATPRISTDCCQQTLDWIRDDDSNTPPFRTLQLQCCRIFDGIALDIRNMRRFVGRLRCCYMCHPEYGL